MVEAAVLASGSRGNCTYLKFDQTAILVDCGLSCKGIVERLERIGVSPDSIRAVFLTHEHDDHVRSIHTFCRRFQVPLVATEATFQAACLGEKKIPDFIAIRSGRVFDQLPGLDVFPCAVPHDAADPVGFVFHFGSERYSVMTDLGYVTDLVADQVRGSRLMVVESNHDPQMLKLSAYPWELKQRIMGRRGHLSNSAAAELVERTVSDDTRQVILAHLSEENNHPDIARMTTAGRLNGHAVNLSVASQREPTDLFRLD